MSGISTAGGTGSSAIEAAYVQMYKRGFEQQFQQFDTRLAGYFTPVAQDSEFEFYDRIGLAEELQENNTRYGPNPMSEIPHDRRRIGLKDYDQGKAMDPKDLLRLASNPTNAYITALKAAAHRKIDKIVRDRIFDIAHVGKGGAGTVTFVGTTANKVTVGNLSKGHSRPISTDDTYTLTAGDVEGIDVNVSYDETTTGTATGLTLDKLRIVRSTMERLEGIDENSTLDCWITSSQAQQLLRIDEVINSDYAVRKALAEGSVTTFMNFRFRRYEGLLGAGSSGNPRQCIVALPNSVKVAYSKNLTFDMWRLTGNKNIPYMYLSVGMDAVRMWGETVARVNCIDDL